VALELKVQGSARLKSTLEKAARDIADMSDGFAEAGRIIDAAGTSGAPRRTGRLASSVRSDRAGRNSSMLTAPVVYAVPIHWGRPAHSIEANPFLMRAADRTEAQWLAALERDAQRICDQVEGQ
jgi:mannose/cellobiose epimerase-like protein (N-acyl-D-glucosamine 2-epimerase family)